MQLSWNKITVKQFQEAHALADVLNNDLLMEPIEKAQHIAVVMYKIPFEKTDTMAFEDLQKMVVEVDRLLTQEPEGKPVKRIKIGKNRYKIIYDLREMTHGQRRRIASIEHKMANIHLLMECLVYRIDWFGRRIYGRKSEVIAEDLLQARFIDVYHATKYYLKLYKNFMAEVETGGTS